LALRKRSRAAQARKRAKEASSTLPVSRLEPTALLHREATRQRRLWQRLHGREAKAFEQLIREGVDRGWLLSVLNGLHNHNPRKVRGVLSRRDHAEIERLQTNLRWVAGELRRLSSFSDGKVWKACLPLVPNEPDVASLSQRCEEAAEFLERLLSYLRRRRLVNASHLRIRSIVRKVKEITGRPHYSEIAQLCSAAYEDSPVFEPDTIKMIATRHR
jgi:hypothetical protein